MTAEQVMSDYWTLKQAAQHNDVTQHTIRRWIREERLTVTYQRDNKTGRLQTLVNPKEVCELAGRMFRRAKLTRLH